MVTRVLNVEMAKDGKVTWGLTEDEIVLECVTQFLEGYCDPEVRLRDLLTLSRGALYARQQGIRLRLELYATAKEQRSRGVPAHDRHSIEPEVSWAQVLLSEIYAATSKKVKSE